jgi:hypothetical protein
MSEYTYNNSKHSAKHISPFYANSKFGPRSTWPKELQFRNPELELYRHHMTMIYNQMSKQLNISIEAMKKYYNTKRKEVKPFQKSDLVPLNGKNIQPRIGATNWKIRCMDHLRFSLLEKEWKILHT